jgi:hypothetical protein
MMSDEQRAGAQALHDHLQFKMDTINALWNMRVRNAAREQFAAEQAQQVSITQPMRLSDMLAQPDDPIAYRIDQLWPIGGRTLLAAQFKAGKTTLVGNMTKSLIDGAPFLGQYEVLKCANVAVIDNELDPRTLRRWLREHNISNTRNVDIIALRGKVGTFDILNESVRAEWAKAIEGADVLIFDCLRPVLDALGLSEDKEAGRFLVAFDALLAEAGISEAMLVHHAGHGGERSRGDSRLRDWPDAEWRLVREDPDDPASSRYFTAFGRDVDVSERRLAYEPLDRSLRVEGGSRKDAKTEAALADVIAFLAGQDGPLSGREIRDGMKDSAHADGAVRNALKRGIREGSILTEHGARNATLHFVSPTMTALRRAA